MSSRRCPGTLSLSSLLIFLGAARKKEKLVDSVTPLMKFLERPSSPSLMRVSNLGFSFRFIHMKKILLNTSTFKIIEKEYSVGGGVNKSKEDSLKMEMENTLNYDNH